MSASLGLAHHAHPLAELGEPVPPEWAGTIVKGDQTRLDEAREIDYEGIRRT